LISLLFLCLASENLGYMERSNLLRAPVSALIQHRMLLTPVQVLTTDLAFYKHWLL